MCYNNSGDLNVDIYFNCYNFNYKLYLYNI